LASDKFDKRGFDATAKDMVKSAKRNGADAVLLVPDNSLVPRAEAVIKAAHQEGIGLLAATNLYREEILKGSCPAIDGMSLSMAWHARGNANADFVKAAASSKFWQGEVNFATAMTYNATQAMAAALQEQPTRAGVYEMLNRADFAVQDTADASPLKFDKNGDRTASAQIVRAQKKEGTDSDKPQCEFVPVK